MQQFLAVAKALGDESRVRALLALRDGELCLCQIIDVLGLAPSTVSKHMELLHQAELVRRRKEGRWHYFRLVGADAPVMMRQAIAWTVKSLRQEKVVLKDAKALCCVRGKDLGELAACYRS